MTPEHIRELLPPYLHIGRRIGSGSYSTVWDAFDERRQGTALALKIARGPSESLRLQTEAYICREAHGLHVPRAFDVGRLDELHSYLLMERFDGFDLDGILLRGPLAVAEAVEITRQVLTGLQIVHGLGMVHRDIKPANVMVMVERSDTIVVKLIDFGIALPFYLAVQDVEDGVVVGTPAYMAPEQIRGEPLDARCDVYGAGALLYELLTGLTPFSGRTPAEIVDSALNDSIIDPDLLRGRVPRELATVTMKALSRDRCDRYSSCDDMSSELAAIPLGVSHRLRLVSGLRSARAYAPTLLDSVRPSAHQTQPIPLVQRHVGRRPMARRNAHVSPEARDGMRARWAP